MSIMQEIKNAIDVVRAGRGGIDALRSRVKELERRREDLHTLPPPRQELVAHVHRMIDAAAGVYPERLAAALRHYAHSPIDAPRAVNHSEGTASQVHACTATEHPQVMATAKTVERALCFILNAQLKEGVRRAIDEMPYTDVVGPRMSDRLKELAAIEKEITSVNAEIKELEAEIAKLGAG